MSTFDLLAKLSISRSGDRSPRMKVPVNEHFPATSHAESGNAELALAKKLRIFIKNCLRSVRIAGVLLAAKTQTDANGIGTLSGFADFFTDVGIGLRKYGHRIFKTYWLA